jgi:F-type H+-transporting ATPase subunit epsilon
MPLKLRIITPERVVFDEENIDSVTLPGVMGEMTILPQHAPIMTELRPGPVLFRRAGEDVDLALSGGFMEVRDDTVIVLADTAERSDEIDLSRAEEARRKAQEELTDRQGTVDIARAMAALERAQARLRVVDRRRRRPGGAPRPTANQ